MPNISVSSWSRTLYIICVSGLVSISAWKVSCPSLSAITDLGYTGPWLQWTLAIAALGYTGPEPLLLATSRHARDGSIYRLIRGLKLSCLITLIEAKSIIWEAWLTTLKWTRVNICCYVRFYGFTALIFLDNFYVNHTSFIWNNVCRIVHIWSLTVDDFLCLIQ